VTTGAENLLTQQAQLVERAFVVKPIQDYGLTEGVRERLRVRARALHVDEDYAVVEFILLGDGLHRLVGTNISSSTTPLLRYESQDHVTLEEGSSCRCGGPGRVIERIDGRLEDYVVLRNGARVGRMDHVFKDMLNIVEAQIRQVTPGELTIRVVRGEKYGDADEEDAAPRDCKRVRYGGEGRIRKRNPALVNCEVAPGRFRDSRRGDHVSRGRASLTCRTRARILASLA